MRPVSIENIYDRMSLPKATIERICNSEKVKEPKKRGNNLDSFDKGVLKPLAHENFRHQNRFSILMLTKTFNERLDYKFSTTVHHNMESFETNRLFLQKTSGATIHTHQTGFNPRS